MDGDKPRLARRNPGPSSTLPVFSPSLPSLSPGPRPTAPHSYLLRSLLSGLHSHSLCRQSTPPPPHSHRSSTMRRNGSTRATSPTNTTYSGISNYRTDSYKPLGRDPSSKDYSNIDPRAVARSHFEELSQYLAAYLAKGVFLTLRPLCPSNAPPRTGTYPPRMVAHFQCGQSAHNLILFLPSPERSRSQQQSWSPPSVFTQCALFHAVFHHIVAASLSVDLASCSRSSACERPHCTFTSFLFLL